jgi:hypothetical protein
MNEYQEGDAVQVNIPNKYNGVGTYLQRVGRLHRVWITSETIDDYIYVCEHEISEYIPRFLKSKKELNNEEDKD